MVQATVEERWKAVADADIIFHAGEEENEVLYTCARPDGMRFHAGAVN